MSKVTMKAEVRLVPPPPPKQEVVITMELHDAILLRDDVRKAITVLPELYYGLNRLIDELDELDLG